MGGRHKVDVEVLTDRVALEGVKSDWISCFERSDASPYLCYDWFRLYQENFGDLTHLRIAVARIDGQACAILPLEKVAVKIGPMAENILRFSGDGFSPQSGAIFAKGVDAADVTRACLSALRAHDPDWKFIRLSKVPTDSEFPAQFRSSPMPGSIEIRLPETWPEFLQKLPGSRRYGIKRKLKKLNKNHEVELVRVGLAADHDSEQLRRALDGALQVSEASWQSRVEAGLAISDEKCRKFFIEASKQMQKSKALDLSVLYLDGSPASFLWGVARWPYTSISKLAYDPMFRELSPGSVHIALHIEDSINRKFAMIDFGHEFPEYKRQWSDEDSALCELWYFPPGMWPTLYRYWYRARRGVRHS
jgi:CelD/BcsL family acetyltransferase involved in cellulose biosynthesis